MKDFITVALMVLCCFAISVVLILAYATGAIFDHARFKAIDYDGQRNPDLTCRLDHGVPSDADAPL